LAQEVSRHVRDQACRFPAPPCPSESLSAVEELPSHDQDATEFGLLAGEELVVDVSFSCKSCGFT
jgi:hypothetical protein